MKRFWFVLWCLLCLVSSTAWATKKHQPPGVRKSVKPVVAPSKNCDSTCQELVAATLLRSAMDFAANDLKIIARKYLSNLLKMYPNTKAAQQGKVWASTPGLFLDQTGRLEFIITSSLYGLAVGGLLPLILEANEAWVYGASILAFGAAGILGGIYGSRGIEISAGQASLINSLGIMGAWNFGSLVGILATNRVITNVTAAWGAGMPLLGATLGFVGGFVLGRVNKVTSGRVTMATSMGTFLGLYTFAILNIARVPFVENNSAPGWTGVLVTSDLGYVAGWLLHSRLRFSRNRIMLLNLGAVLGAATGGAVVALTQSLYTDDRVIWGMLLGFSVAGVAVSAYLTRHFKQEDESNPFARKMAYNGALFNFQGKNWGFGVPSLAIAPEVRVGNQLGLQVQVPLVSGKW